MTEDQMELMQEAQDSISAAKLLLESGYPGYSASRAYYAMFYIAEAFLEGEGMAFSKHSAVIAAFGKSFVHSGKVPLEFHRFLVEGQELRHAGDYGRRQAVSYDKADAQIARAMRFLELAVNIIGPITPPLPDSP